MQRFKTSNSLTFNCSVESLWEIVSSPNYLNNVHPFCKENSIIQWSGEHHEDNDETREPEVNEKEQPERRR